MNKIPSTIKVAGVNYKVIEKESIEVNGDKNCLGSCGYTDSTIEILSDMSEERKWQILIHELTHACFFESGFDKQEEDMINRISIVLHQVLRDNNLNMLLDNE